MPLRVPSNRPKKTQDSPKRGQRCPKMAPRGAQEGQKTEPEGKKRTVLDLPRARVHKICAPPGAHLGPKIEPNLIPKRPNIEANFRDPRRSGTRLGAILSRFGALSWMNKSIGKHDLSSTHIFEDKTRRLEDGLGRSCKNRPPNDQNNGIEIDVHFDTNSKARQGKCPEVVPVGWTGLPGTHARVLKTKAQIWRI